MSYQLTLRGVKGSPLTNAEVDANFNNLYTDVQTRLLAEDYNADDVVGKIKEIEENIADISVYKLNGYISSSENDVDTVVRRDSNGDFQAGTVTATTFIGNVTGNITGNLTGTVTGNASNVNGTVALNNGGTGGTTAASARTNLGLGTIATQNSSAISVTGGTITGITDITIADGGTGASTASQARSNLGLSIGSDVQPFSNELTGIAAATATGFYVRVGAANVTQRSFAVGGNGLTISNADGTAGNVTISLPTSATPTFASLTTTASISVGTSLSVSGTSTLVGVNCGSITSSGSITATGNIIGYYSDDRLKDKLGRIENALDKLCSLEGFYFTPSQTAKDLGYTETNRQVGVSAQSTQQVLPEVVGPAPIDAQYLTVDYARMVPLIIEAIKELREEFKALK